MREYDKFY